MKNANKTEAAMLRGVVSAVVALLLSLGVVVNAEFVAQVDTLIVLGATALPILQGWFTRRNVWSQASVEEAVETVLGGHLEQAAEEGS